MTGYITDTHDTTSQTMQINVAPVEDRPEFLNPDPDTAYITLGARFVYRVSAFNGDGDLVSFDLYYRPEWLSFDCDSMYGVLTEDDPEYESCYWVYWLATDGKNDVYLEVIYL